MLSDAREAFVPKSHDGIVQSVRTLHVLKRSALKARTQATDQMPALIVTAPEATRRTIRTLARCCLDLTNEINTHNGDLDEPVRLNALRYEHRSPSGEVQMWLGADGSVRFGNVSWPSAVASVSLLRSR